MSWLNLNESLNSLKGQITNFASDMLSEGVAEDSGDNSVDSSVKFKELEEKCREQELEIEELKKKESELLQKRNGLKDDASSWYWDVPLQGRPPEGEAKLLEQIHRLQEQISHLKRRKDDHGNQEVERLKEENRNLSQNLDQLDKQHQFAMEKLLALKVELQKNFELLKKEHEDMKNTNDEYLEDMKVFQAKIKEKDDVIRTLSKVREDYETLHHKYQNVERVHSILKENAEKFQEENQELHEEVFKLQEQVTKLEHDMEVMTKSDDSVVPRHEYDKLLKEFEALKIRNTTQVLTDEMNIDDNAKSVIENLKREISSLKHEMNQVKDSSSVNDTKSDKIFDLLNKYVSDDSDLPPEASASDNTILKLEHALKYLYDFKRDKEKLYAELLEKDANITHMQTQIDDLTSENDFLTSDLQHYERESKEMKKNNDFLISEIAALKNSSKLEPIIETHEDNIMLLENELANCSKKNKTYESEVKRISSELEEVKVEKVYLQSSLNDLKVKYTAMLKSLDLCQAQTKALEELESSVLDKDVEVDDEINDLKKRLIVATSRNEEKALTLQIIENEKVLLLQKVNDLTEQLKNKNSANDAGSGVILMQNKVKDLQTQFDELHQQKVALESVNTDLKDEISELKAQLQVASENREKTITENEDVTALLYSDNKALKGAVEEITKEISILENKEKELLEDNNNLKESLKKCARLEAEINVLNNENKTLKMANQELLKSKSELAECQRNTDGQMEILKESFEKIVKELSHKNDIIESLNKTQANLTQINNELEISQKANIKEIEDLKKNVADLNNNLANISKTQTDEMNTMIQNKHALETEINKINDELNLKNKSISEIGSKLEDAIKISQEYRTALEDKINDINELNNTIAILRDNNSTTINDKCLKLTQEKDEISIKAKELKESLESNSKELTEWKTKVDNLEKLTLEHQIAIDNATKEKAELINLVTLKHNESLQYHQEIQRLNQIILERAKETEVKNEDAHNNGACQNCENLRVTLKEKDEIIKKLHNNGTDVENLKSEVAAAKEHVRSLMEKCSNYESSLSNQLEAVQRLKAENSQLSEREIASTKELERLRSHLVETEESHTQELMNTEQKLADAVARLNKVEERAKQNSTVYTSNSIRANQEVETYRAQIRLLEKQREEAAGRLAAAEEAKVRGETALSNLQLVLEQFQADKERDIEAATVKLQNKMAEKITENSHLHEEINRLNKKLEESIAGLQAASRLGEQLESKTAIIQELKEQVQALQSSVAAAEERYYNTVSNQQDKVDRRLVKNLVLNYVQTQGQSSLNRTQVLRILSSVLDFNQEECVKLGLGKGSNAPDSLAREFVNFLERESRPTTAPTMMRLDGDNSGRETTGASPQPTFEHSHKRNLSSGSNNLLFHHLEETSSQVSLDPTCTERTPAINMSDTGVNQTRSSESSILKSVLKDL